MKLKYVYPCLSASKQDFYWFRISGPGLANCMILAAKAYCVAKKCNAKFIEPTWFKLSLGPYLRGEKDKRHYFHIFNPVGIRGLKKAFVLSRKAEFDDNNLNVFEAASEGLCKIKLMRHLFQDMDSNIVSEYFERLIREETKTKVNSIDFSKSIAVHIRLGDFNSQQRTPISWYVTIIKQMKKINADLQFLIFSDGEDEELSDVLHLQDTKHVFFGDAISDIYAISRCKCVIASNSTFSAMGAFIGKVPILYHQREFGPIFNNTIPEAVIPEGVLPEIFVQHLSNY